KDQGMFRYKFALYSAGHAYLDEERGRKYEPMIWNRPDDTILLSDSGGYQIASGILNFDWDGGPGSPKNDKIREDILRWQEKISDIAMTLDIPTRAIANPKA